MAGLPFDAPSGSRHGRGQLALALQEALTATARLRANRQVASDPASFRSHMKRLLSAADSESRSAGYPPEDVKLAIYAVVAFLDESVLNSRQPMFAEWPQKPLQEEVFGEHMAGEFFFDNLRQLLARQDSEDLADLLEVYHLCLLLGFKGRYTGSDRGELHQFTSTIGDKILRIRGGVAGLSPAWRLPADERAPKAKDPWVRRMGYVAAGILGIVVLQFVLFRLMLGPGVRDLRDIASSVGG